jgi:hypothetical protein
MTPVELEQPDRIQRLLESASISVDESIAPDGSLVQLPGALKHFRGEIGEPVNGHICLRTQDFPEMMEV